MWAVVGLVVVAPDGAFFLEVDAHDEFQCEIHYSDVVDLDVDVFHVGPCLVELVPNCAVDELGPVLIAQLLRQLGLDEVVDLSDAFSA